jgi:hypothetical protein
MIFCGQCGLQIALGTIRCPRCGTTVEETKDAEEASHVNNPTIAGQSLPHLSQAGTMMASTPQQPLILRLGTTTSSYSPQDATSMMEAPIYNTNMPPGQAMGTQFPSGGVYPTQQASYPNYSMPGNTYAPGGIPSGTYLPTGATSQRGYGGPQQQNTSATNGNPTMRIAGLIIACFGVLLILSAVILFLIQ